MDKKIIILAGYPAAGKTTFSEKLIKRLNLPCFTKDLIKIVLGEGLQMPNSRPLSDTAFWALAHVTERIMLSGQSLIIESSFKEWEGEVIRELIQKYSYNAITFLFLGDLEILHKRFIDRDTLPERHEITRINGALNDYERFRSSMSKLGNFDIGTERIIIDTTTAIDVDFSEFINKAETFMREKVNI